MSSILGGSRALGGSSGGPDQLSPSSNKSDLPTDRPPKASACSITAFTVEGSAGGVPGLFPSPFAMEGALVAAAPKLSSLMHVWLAGCIATAYLWGIQNKILEGLQVNPPKSQSIGKEVHFS